MGLKSDAMMQGVIVLALVAAWCVSARADLRIAPRANAAAAGFEDADAASYCFQSQADGCWLQATVDAERLAARLDTR